jgi:hypothetical protein
LLVLLISVGLLLGCLVGLLLLIGSLLLLISSSLVGGFLISCCCWVCYKYR